MENITINTAPTQRSSLVDAIANVHSEFAQMKDQLRAAHQELLQERAGTRHGNIVDSQPGVAAADRHQQ